MCVLARSMRKTWLVLFIIHIRTSSAHTLRTVCSNSGSRDLFMLETFSSVQWKETGPSIQLSRGLKLMVLTVQQSAAILTKHLEKTVLMEFCQWQAQAATVVFQILWYWQFKCSDTDGQLLICCKYLLWAVHLCSVSQKNSYTKIQGEKCALLFSPVTDTHPFNGPLSGTTGESVGGVAQW